MVDAVNDCFAGVGEEFFLEAINKLESWCKKCIHTQGDYVENKGNLHFRILF